MIGRPIPRPWYFVLGLFSVGLILLGYTWLSYRQHQINPKDKSIPSWRQLGEGVRRVLTPQRPSGEIRLVRDAKATFGRLAAGLLIGVALAVALGLLMGCYPAAEALLLWPLAFLARIPPTAMLAVYFVLVAIGFKLFVTLLVVGVLPLLTQTVYLAVRKDVPMELIDKAHTLGATKLEIVWSVIFAQILPRIIDAARLQIGPAMVYLIAAEWLIADVGFGYRLRMESRLLNMNVVYTYLVVLGVAGYALDHTLVWTRRRLCPWFV